MGAGKYLADLRKQHRPGQTLFVPLHAQTGSVFHYRNIDVSTVKELAARWAPHVKDGFTKESSHQALDDIIESIEELRYYREHFIRF